jgi:hypothetical protein
MQITRLVLIALALSSCIHYTSVQAHIYTPLEKWLLDPLHADSSVWYEQGRGK